MIRRISAVIAGYAIFVVSSLALFKLSGQNPYGLVSPGFQIFTLIYGIVFSVASGWVCQWVSRSGSLVVTIILASVMAGFAIFSLLKAEGTHWSQWMAILVFAPSSLAGGFLKRRQ